MKLLTSCQQLCRQLYPSWTARDNYAINARKRKKRDIYRDEDARRNDGSTDDGRSTGKIIYC